MVKWLRNFWLGDVRLCVSFWIYGVLGVTLLPPILVYLFGMIGLKFRINTPYLFAILAGLIFLIYGVFAIVGIWRSAVKYQGPRKWSLITKFVIIGFAALLLYNILTIQHQLEYLRSH